MIIGRTSQLSRSRPVRALLIDQLLVSNGCLHSKLDLKYRSATKQARASTVFGRGHSHLICESIDDLPKIISTYAADAANCLPSTNGPIALIFNAPSGGGVQFAGQGFILLFTFFFPLIPLHGMFVWCYVQLPIAKHLL